MAIILDCNPKKRQYFRIIIQKYGNNFGLALAVNNKLRHVIAHYMVAVWYKPWSSMVQSMEPYGTMFDFPKSLGHSPKVFGTPPQSLWGYKLCTIELEGLYHRRLRFIPQPFIESVADVHS